MLELYLLVWINLKHFDLSFPNESKDPMAKLRKHQINRNEKIMNMKLTLLLLLFCELIGLIVFFFVRLRDGEIVFVDFLMVVVVESLNVGSFLMRVGLSLLGNGGGVVVVDVGWGFGIVKRSGG